MTSKHNLDHTTNQNLPKALYYGRNLLALRHDASGVRLAFDAREKRLFFKTGRVDGVSRRWRKRGGGVLVSRRWRAGGVEVPLPLCRETTRAALNI